MLAHIRPLLTEQVQHVDTRTRNVFGGITGASGTWYPARVVEIDGRLIAPASATKVADASAIVWLLNHPRPVAVGDTFKLSDGRSLAAVRVERRTMAGDTLTKVYLS